ncbi:hypothetical protein [Floridanema evergladense]|uniref:Uncharacterized protein n=1 Tax=Floridaenema evergladense BLCC-F167 TaxID=3153639 RepID=A0ABV4WWH8_9CYAN
MNIPAIVDVVIGLIFIYLILSLLASEIQELIATVLQWRAQHLKQSIINLLAGDTIADRNIEAAKRLTKDLYNHPLLNDINQEARGLFAIMFRKVTWFVSWVYQGITGREGVFGNKVSAPSYIPGETFATVLIDRLGIAKLVEPLVEAKFDRFRNSIIENIGNIIDGNEEILNLQELEAELNKKSAKNEYYKLLQVDLYRIYKQFTNRELTLITAVDKISLRIDRFITQLPDEKPKKELAMWKLDLFGVQNELAIANGGLKPTLEEIADLINLNSRTYQAYKEQLQTYYRQRYQNVVDELQNFLLLFDASTRIIINPLETDFLTKDSILESPDYAKFWANDSIDSGFKLSMPLSSMDREVVNIIQTKIQNNSPEQDKLEAFKQGFGEEARKMMSFKLLKLRRKDIFSFGILLGFLIVAWNAVFLWVNFFITPEGGIVLVLIIITTLGLILLVNQDRNSKNLNQEGNLENLASTFFATASKIENSEENLINQYTSEFKNEIGQLNKNPDNLNWELIRLGQCFRQNYRVLVNDNADIDLPFIPSSVKQSVATLVRRAKTKIDRTGNEVIQLREEIEIWFDRSMARTSGVYKRNAKGVSLLIGFGLAILTNSNSIYIANQLAYDRELRQAVAQGAERFIADENQQSSSLSEDRLRDRSKIVSQILDEQLKLPIGWSPRILGKQLNCELPRNARDDDWEKLFDKCIKTSKKDRPLNFDVIYNAVANERKKDNPTRIYEQAQERYKKAREKSRKSPIYFVPTAILVMIINSGKWLVGILFLVGWFVTSVAISMGSSFWFDMLNKVINVRNTGSKPPSLANQTSVNSEKSS